MTVTQETLRALYAHWALQAITEPKRRQVAELVNQRLVKNAVGSQIAFDFIETSDDDDLLSRVALAYETAAIEGLDALSRPSGSNGALRSQCVAAACQAFDILRLSPVPDGARERIFHVLHLSAIAYCGDRWTDLRRWYRENLTALEVPQVDGVPWDRRLLYRIFDCWQRLFWKKGWDDLSHVHRIILGLREEQETHEAACLNQGLEAENRAAAFRLVALYHWAKGTEILAGYVSQGEPQGIFSLIDKHFEAGIRAAAASGDAGHEIILRWLHAAGRVMVTNSLWWATRTVNSRMTRFVRSLTTRDHRPLFELLPPQRAALLEQGLLDPAKTAIVIDMPTSGGKTLLAQFRILQALNQFDADQGWVAYVAPTRALSAQITRRLRRDFAPIGIRVEQLTGAVEVDAFEEALLTDKGAPFGVLVATPEKLSLVIRNRKVARPLALVVMDEAHNIEAEERGLRIELLLATIKGDCPTANFLLLMPYVEEAETLARWLAQDVNAGRSISFGATAWKPNERIIGVYRVVPDDSVRAGWCLNFETLTVTEKALHLRGTHQVDGVKPFDVPLSKAKGNQSLQTAAMATVLSGRGTSVAVATSIPSVWSMARRAANALDAAVSGDPDIRLVQDFLRTEIGPQFELVKMLDHRVGVHHAGLSDETRSLMEWLAEEGKLRVLCATSTISQGINFPVSSVFLASRHVPHKDGYSTEMAPREFWNLAGRAGRIDHDAVGVIGLAEGKHHKEIIAYLSRATGALVSRLVSLVEDAVERGKLNSLDQLIYRDDWADFRCYIAHLWAEKRNLDAVLADLEQTLRQTLGYTVLRDNPATRERAAALLDATKSYAKSLAEKPGLAILSDQTGFSPEGIGKAISGLGKLEERLKPTDWAPDSLFGQSGRMADLFGIMLNIPQIKEGLEKIAGEGPDHARLSNITKDWVNGASLSEIAKAYFSSGNEHTDSLTEACRAIYRTIVNSGTWGMSALSRLGLDLDALSDQEKQQINALPAMIYHGVRSERAVLMRMNAVPRSAAEALGELYRTTVGTDHAAHSVGSARDFLRNLNDCDWDRARPANAALSGSGYQRLWHILSGEGG